MKMHARHGVGVEGMRSACVDCTLPARVVGCTVSTAVEHDGSVARLGVGSSLRIIYTCWISARPHNSRYAIAT